MNNIYKLIPLLILALVSACDKNEEVYTPDLKLASTGDVRVVAGIENCATTRASVISTGEARWLAQDAIGLVCSDGSVITLPLDGTGETRRAFFSGTIPAGKSLGKYAVHPASVTVGENVLSVNLPQEMSPNSFGDCSVMVAPIMGSPEITFKQLMSYVTLQIKEVSADAAKLVVSSDKSLSGSYSVDIEEGLESGLPAKIGEGTITINLPAKKDATITATFAVPVGEYQELKVDAVDENGRIISEVNVLESAFNARRGVLRVLSAVMPEAQTEIPEVANTVYIAGVYWCTGNLLYSEGETQEGFRTNWKLADEQYQFVNYENMKGINEKVTFSPGTYTPKYDHFNWGGISDPFSKDAMSSAVVPVGFDISGKLYLDQKCTVSTEDFAAAKYGDIAFWASNGKFRLPTSAEINKLITETNIQYASVKVGEGKYVTGFLFTDPAPGELPKTVEEPIELTPEQLATGLFLPKAGRRYNSADFTVQVQGTQAVYWGSESITGDGATEPCYGLVLSIQNAAVKYPYWNKAFDAKAGFSVRPVYNK